MKQQLLKLSALVATMLAFYSGASAQAGYTCDTLTTIWYTQTRNANTSGTLDNIPPLYIDAALLATTGAANYDPVAETSADTLYLAAVDSLCVLNLTGARWLPTLKIESSNADYNQFYPVYHANAGAYGMQPAALSTALSGQLAYDASNPLGCLVGTANPWTAGQFAGKVLIIERGTCTFVEKQRNAQQAGAIAVILSNNTNATRNADGAACCFAPDATASDLTIPTYAVSYNKGQELIDDATSGTNIMATLQSNELVTVWADAAGDVYSNSTDTVTMNYTPGAGAVYQAYVSPSLADCDGSQFASYSNAYVHVISQPSCATTGLNDVTLANKVSILPNPNNGNFEIRVNGNEMLNVTIVNALGNEVYTKRAINSNTSVNMSNLAAGTYYVRINNNETSATKSFVIVK